LTRARIILADDHKEVRDRVATTVARGIRGVGAVERGSALLEAKSKMQPDVCVGDISMLGLCELAPVI